MKLAYRRMSVLLADPTAVDAISRYLEEFQFFRVWTAKTGPEAVELLGQKPLNLVICGLKLKTMTGFQVLAAARANPRLANLPFLLIMDRKDKAQEDRAAQQGVTGFINLPLEAQAVRRTVAQVLEPFIDPVEETFLQKMHEARRAVTKKDWATAEEAYRAAIAVRADEEAQLGLGRILGSKGDWPGAEQSFIAALRLNPQSLRAFLGLAQVYEAMGRLEDALKVLAGALVAAKKLQKAGSVTSSIYFYIGEIELRLRHLNEAMGNFDRALDESPDDAKLAARAGDLLAEAGFLAESEGYYSKALEMDPELAHVYNRLGIAYRKQKKFKLALNLYAKARAFHPEDENLCYNIARCHFDQENWEAAANLLGEALKLNPEFRDAQRLLDAALHRLGHRVSEDGKVPEPPEG